MISIGPISFFRDTLLKPIIVGSLLLFSAAGNGASVYVMNTDLSGMDLVLDPVEATATYTRTEFESFASANLGAGDLQASCSWAYAGTSFNYCSISAGIWPGDQLRLTNVGVTPVTLGAGALYVDVFGTYTLGQHPSVSGPGTASASAAADLWVFKGTTAYYAGGTHSVGITFDAGGNIVSSYTNFDNASQYGGQVDVFTDTLNELHLGLSVPALTLAPGEYMDLYAVFGVLSSGENAIALADFAQTTALSLVLPAGASLEGNTTVPLEWVRPVPVPAAAYLFASGLVALAGVARRKAA